MAIIAPSLAGYTFVGNIGKGTTSEVFLYKDRLKKQYAVKVSEQDQAIVDLFKRELAILSQIESCPYAPKLSECVSISPFQLAIIMDYIPYPSLREVADDKFQILKIAKLRNMMLDMLAALEFLDSREIIHGDVKEENILVNPFGRAKLIDFGISHSYKNGERPQIFPICTITHRPPEVILDKTLDSSVDTWSLGMTAFSAYIGDYYFYAGCDTNERSLQALELNQKIDLNYLWLMENSLGPAPSELLLTGMKTSLFYHVALSETGDKDAVYTLKHPQKPLSPPKLSIRDAFLERAQKTSDSRSVALEVAEVVEKMIRWENRISPKQASLRLNVEEGLDVLVTKEINNWGI